MREIALAIIAALAFLFPVAGYCFVLASINRRTRPLMVSGVWDTVGLLCAGSGFFLVTVPMLLTGLYLRAISAVVTEPFFSIWLLLWFAYFVLLLGGGVLMVVWRGHKTVVYNVDTELFARAMERALAAVGLSMTKQRQRLILTPALPLAVAEPLTGITERPTPGPRADAERRHAELEIENFPAMCHVTLHWGKYTPEVRQEVEDALQKELPLAAPQDNPAAGWFLTISGLVFGALFMAAVTCAMMILFPRH